MNLNHLAIHQKLTGHCKSTVLQSFIKGNVDNTAIVVGDFNIPLSITYRKTRQEISKGTENLKNTINQYNLVMHVECFTKQLRNTHSFQ